MHCISRSCALIPMILASNVLADEVGLKLAKFSEGEGALQNLIEFPNVEGDVSVAVYCVADIMGTGRVFRIDCFESESVDHKYIRAIEKTARDARATPAVVDGQEYITNLYFRTVFMRQGGEQYIGVFPNWGHDVDSYGLEYHAPQRYSNAVTPRNCVLTAGTFRAFSTLRIGVDGSPVGDVSFDRSDKDMKDQDCRASLSSLLKVSEYIPGENEGNPIETTIVEAWGDKQYMVVE